MFSVLASSAVDRGFELRSDETKDYKIGICCFSAKHAALRGKSKDWLARNQDNVYPRIVVSVRKHHTNSAKSEDLVQSGHHFIEKLTCSRHNIAEKLLSWH
jgi:hypothetical protein